MKSLWIWIVLGLVVRLVIMGTTVHPDIRGHNLAAYLISQRGQLFTFYDHLRQQPRDDPWVMVYGDGLFIYPPLAYWTHAIFMYLLGPIYPWEKFLLLINNMGQLTDQSYLLILLKFPYLVADGLGLWLITKMVEKKQQFLVGILWIFNPVTIYASYMVGQFDIYIAVLILASLAALKSKSWLSAVLLGLAAGFKPFPLVLAPLLGVGWKEKVKLTGIALVTYALQIVPYLGSTGFKHYALIASQTDKMWYAKVMVSGGQYLPLFLIGLVSIWWWNYFKPRSLPTWGWFMTVLLLFFSLTHYHPQWFVWVGPLLLVAFVQKVKIRLPVVILILIYVAVVFSFEPSLNFGLFNLPYSLKSVLTDMNVSLLRAVFAATALATILTLKGGDDL